jgi:holo-[acyl-carrier protein] synthase
MIVGFGIDIMSTVRIQNAVQRFGDLFTARIYTDYEREFAGRRGKYKYQVYTAFWATKEAAMKALGTGNRKGVRFRDIEIRHERSGKPHIILYSRAKERSAKLSVDGIAVSMSHLEDIVVASVIFEKNQ